MNLGPGVAGVYPPQAFRREVFMGIMIKNPGIQDYLRDILDAQGPTRRLFLLKFCLRA